MKPMTTWNIAAVATLLGASLLMSVPSAVQADQGKWWQPKESRRGDRRAEGRVESRQHRGGQRGAETRYRSGQRVETRQYRSGQRGYDGPYRSQYRSGQRGGFDRQYRQWRGSRVYRDVITIRGGYGGYRGPQYRAWRSYCEPEFIYSRRIVRIRPIRYFAATVVIGGVHVGARYNDYDDCYYGCNFCDARFESYGAYRAHVYGCDARPHGYRIEASDWNDRELRDSGWWDDRNWVRDHTYEGDRDHGDYGDRDYGDRDTGDRYYDRNRDYDDDRDYDNN